MQAVIYARVSTDGQEENFSTASQVEACTRYAQQHGFTIVGVFQDVASGAVIDRPKLDQVRELIRQGEIQAVIAYASDRLTRNVAHSYLLRDEMKRAGVGLHYATRGQSQDSAEGNLFDTIDAAFAEYERLKINERTRRGRKRKLEEGKLLGQGIAPFGYRWVGDARTPRLEIVPSEAAIIQRIYDLFTISKLGTFEITQRLRAEGVRGRRGGLWAVATTRYVLKNRLYSGVAEHNKSERLPSGSYRKVRDPNRVVAIEGMVEPLISEGQWARAQALLATNKQHSKGNRKRFYLLAHRVRCSCGRGMAGVSKNNGKHRYYMCCKTGYAIQEPCPTSSSVQANRIEQAVWQSLLQVVNPTHIRAGLELVRQQQQAGAEDGAQQVRTLERERDRIEQAHQKMIAAYQADAIGLDDLKASKDRTHRELESIQRELARLKGSRKTVITAEEERETIALVEHMHAALGNLTDEERLQVIEALDVRARVLLVERKRLQLDVISILGEYTVMLDSGALSVVDKTVQIVLL